MSLFQDGPSTAKDVGSDGSDSQAAATDLSKRRKERRKSSKKNRMRFSAGKKRLSGGGDEPQETAENDQNGQNVQNDNEEEGDPDTKTTRTMAAKSTISAAPSKSVVALTEDSEPLKSTGDPRVDEMFECALTNLEEAGKALASLGENLEHEMKLFLVELMGRMRKWMGGVEGKIEWARRDILGLHKEIESKIATVAELRRDSQILMEQLKGAEQAKNLAQKSLADTLGGKGGQALGKVPSQARSVQLGPIMEQCMKSRSDTRTKCGQSQTNMSPEIATLREQQDDLVACCAELENEVLELRKENQRIVKERAEYENAIQRALLKGVSSLNVEALKVLRCTPMPTCCPPCPSDIEPVKSNGGCGGGGQSKPQSPSGGATCGGNNSYNGGNGRGASAKNPCPASAHGERRSKKNKDNNMLLLLHQKDAENFGIQTGCDNQSQGTKKTNVCGGGGCGRGSKHNNNNMC